VVGSVKRNVEVERTLVRRVVQEVRLVENWKKFDLLVARPVAVN
jgi:hypothetical protein